MTQPVPEHIESVIRYTGSGEWSVLYVNGQLDTYGDHYLIDERIATIFGVQEEDTDHWYRGDGGRDFAIPQTVEKAEEWRREDRDAAEKAKTLREQADALLQRAKELEDRAHG